jgi:stage II sporulation protein AA (anti-sigma F factor antagonist)
VPFLCIKRKWGGDGMMQLERERVHYEVQQNCLVVYVSDDLDHHAVLKLREYSDRLIEAGNVKHIIFDFTDVGFMDSSGIGLIMGRYKKVMFLGGRAAVTNVGEVVNRIFTLSGLYQIIERYDTVADALEGMKHSRRQAENGVEKEKK